MKRNPYIPVFGFKKRAKEPGFVKRDLKDLKRILKKEPPGSRLPKKPTVRWRDKNMRFVKFTKRKMLQGVVQIIPPPRKYGKKDKAKLAKRRTYDRKRRTLKAALEFRKNLASLMRLVSRYPNRHPVYRDEFLPLFTKKWERLRERISRYGGPAGDEIAPIEQLFAQVEEGLGLERGAPSWVPLEPMITAMLARPPHNLPIDAWKQMYGVYRSKMSGARPLEMVRVNNGDPFSHPAGSANLLMWEEELHDRLLDSTRASSWAIFAVCQLPPEWDRHVDKHGIFSGSPDPDKRKSPQYFESMMDQKKRVLKALWVDYKAKRVEMDERHKRDARMTLAAKREEIFTLIKNYRVSRNKARREYASKGPGKRFVIMSCPIVYRQQAIMSHGRVVDMEKPRTLRQIHDFLFTFVPKRLGNPFSNQFAWQENMQRYYWSRGRYVFPVLFLGYTPRTIERTRGVTREAAVKEAEGK